MIKKYGLEDMKDIKAIINYNNESFIIREKENLDNICNEIIRKISIDSHNNINIKTASTNDRYIIFMLGVELVYGEIDSSMDSLVFLDTNGVNSYTVHNSRYILKRFKEILEIATISQESDESSNQFGILIKIEDDEDSFNKIINNLKTIIVLK